MAFNAGAIIASIQLNTAAFTQQIRQVGNQVRQLGTQMQGTFGSNSAINTGFRDMERIIGGILISQAFYRISQAATKAAKDVFEFSGNMDKAAVSLQYFLGSEEKARVFLDVMKDFAAITPFTTEQSVTLSRRLMAMGFEAKHVKGVMNIMTDAASATGGTAAQMDRVVLALGQMKTNGYIAGQELRQLAEATVPAYKILQQELGLTKDQLKNVGKLKISGDLGVAAILKGLEKRYKGAAAKLAETVPGLMSTIKDDFLIISGEITKGAYTAFGGVLKSLRDTMEKARKILRTGGFGGLFEYLIPPKLQLEIRTIIASIRSLAGSLTMLVKAFGPVIALIVGAFIQALSMVLPTVTAVVRTVASLVSGVLKAAAPVRMLAAVIGSLIVAFAAAKALMFLWTITRMGMICTLVAEAVQILAIAIKGLFLICTRNPVVGIIMLIAGALLYLAISSKQVSAWLDEVTAKLATLGGIDTTGILSPEHNKDLASTTDEFNARLEDMNKNLKNTGKEAAAAGKKVKDKFLASFDEVYQIPEKLGETTDELEDLGNFDDLFFDIPPFKLPDVNKKTEGPDKPFKFPFIPPLIAKKDKPKGGSGSGTTSTEGAVAPSSPGPRINTTPMEAAVGILEALAKRARKALDNIGTSTIPMLNITPFEIVANTLNGIASAADNVRLAFQAMAGTTVLFPILNVAQEVWKSLSSVPGAFEEVKKAITAALLDLALFMVEKWIANIEWVAAHWKEILIGTIIAIVAVVLFIFGGEIVAAIGGVGALAVEAFSAMGAAISAFFSTGLAASVAGSISTGFAAIAAAVIAAILIALPMITSKWKGITDTISGSWNSVTKATSTAWSTIKQVTVSTSSKVKDAVTTAWNNIKSLTSTTFSSVKNAITTTWNMAGSTTTRAVDGIKTGIVGAWSTIQTTTSSVWGGIKGSLSSTVEGIKTIFGGLKTSLLGIWDDINLGITTVLNKIIDSVNVMGTGLSALSIDLPDWIDGGGKKVGISIPPIPHLATGGIVNRDTLIRAGEGNKREAVVPLQSEYMRPFSKAVAEDLAGMGSFGSNKDDRPILYVGTLIADDKSLRDLERRMKVIRLQEKVRGV